MHQQNEYTKVFQKLNIFAIIYYRHAVTSKDSDIVPLYMGEKIQNIENRQNSVIFSDV